MNVYVRNEFKSDAQAACDRLAAKYPDRKFAVVLDDMGIPGFAYPHAVVELAQCDYCPNTWFAGAVCPTCGYDYANVSD